MLDIERAAPDNFSNSPQVRHLPKVLVLKLPPQRLRTYLILFAVALTLPLMALALFALRELADIEQEAVEERVVQVAQALAANVDRELSRAMVTLDTLATSRALEEGDLARFHDQTQRAIDPQQAGILLIDRTLKQLINSRAPFGTDLPPTSDPETANRVFATAERQVSDVFVGVISKQHVINIEVPVILNGTVRYVLIMAVDAVRFVSLLQAQGLSSPWLTEIVDRKGIILARSELHGELVGRPADTALLPAKQAGKGLYRAQRASGESVLGASARSGVSGWLVSASVPMAFAEASQHQGRLFSWSLIATGFSLSALLAIAFGAYITRPLTLATAAAAEVGRGNIIEPSPSALAEANALTLALSDASKELKRRHDHTEFLLRELAHRSKNQLAVILGIATQTARHTASTDEFMAQFSRRVQGLAKSQDLLVRRNWEGASLDALVRGHLDLFGAQHRAEIDGPKLELDANAVQNVGFALHELGTNATKYGALATSNARLQVSWKLTDTGRLHIHWIESNIPVSDRSARQGFGTLVISKLVPQSLQGVATLQFGPQSLHWHLDIPDTFVLREA